MSFRTSSYFQDKPQTPCLGTRPLWSGSFLHLQPPLLMGLCPLTDTPASFSRSHLPLLCFPRTLALAVLSSFLLPGYPQLMGHAASQARLLERLLLTSPARPPSSGRSLTAQQAAPRFLQAQPWIPHGFVNGGLSWVLASRVWLCPLQYSWGMVQCLSQSGRSVKFGECVKKYVVFVKVIPGCWGGGSLQHHRPGPYDRKTMSWAPHTVCIMCPLYRW